MQRTCPGERKLDRTILFDLSNTNSSLRLTKLEESIRLSKESWRSTPHPVIWLSEKVSCVDLYISIPKLLLSLIILSNIEESIQSAMTIPSSLNSAVLLAIVEFLKPLALNPDQLLLQ